MYRIICFLLAFKFFQIFFLTAAATAQEASPLFQSDAPLELRYTVNTAAFLADRGDNPQYHWARLQWQDSAAGSGSVDAKLRARGHFRKNKSICRFAPVLVNLDSASASGVFAGQTKLKLVVPCVSDELVYREFLVYKIYNLLTPFSMRARLARVQLVDSADGTKVIRYLGFLLEPPEQVARRNGMNLIRKNGLDPQFLPPSDFSLMAVFQFFIGNTDWSIQFQQNIEFLAINANAPPTPVPYDFDHSGIVDAPYAEPSAELELSSTRQRRYRGYCLTDLGTLQPVFQQFKDLRPQIEALYRDNPQLSSAYRKLTLGYIEDFYSQIANPRRMREAFNYPCLPGGTGGVIIKGLKN